MQIGYAQAVITPALDPLVYMAGFAHNRIAQSVHYDLFARAFAMQDEACKCVVLVAVDLIGLFHKDVGDAIAQVQAHERFHSGDQAAPTFILSAVHPTTDRTRWACGGRTHAPQASILSICTH